MVGCSRIGLWAHSALLLVLGTGASVFGQSAGSLVGQVTDVQSRPQGGATVTVRNQATGGEAHATSLKSVSYRFTGLGPGEYSLEAEVPQLDHGHLEGIVVAHGHESRVQAALLFEPDASRPEQIAVSQARNELASPQQPSLVSAPGQARLPARFAPPETIPDRTPPTELSAITPSPARLALQGASVPAIPPAGEVPASLAIEPGFRPAGEALVRAAALSARTLCQSALDSPASAASSGVGDNPLPTYPVDTFTADELQSLPLAERSWEPVALDLPHTAPDDSSDSSVEGRELPAGLIVDGISTRLAFGAGTSRRQGRSASLIGPGSSDAVLREVQAAAGNIEQSAGRGMGGGSRVETARGGDALHGQALLFERQGLWGAQNPFTQWTQETAPATATTVPVFTAQPLTPTDREASWGLSAGGRLARTRFHWFASLDSSQRNDPGVSTVKHPENFFAQPSNDQMQVLAARLGLSSVDPVGEGIAAYSGMLETLAGLLGPAPRTVSRWTGFGRLDASLTPRSRLTIEGTGADRDAPGGGLSRAAETYGTHSYGSSHTGEQWLMARWESLAAPSLIAVTQASFGRHNLTQSPSAPSPFERTLDVNVWGRPPQMVVDSSNGFTIGNPARFGSGSYPDERITQAQEQLAWTHGKLLLRAGLEFSHNSDTTTFVRNQTGTYTYASVENFASDALTFAAFGLNGQLNPFDQHNCDQTGKVWRDSSGALRGLGYLPCYSHYTQTMGPTNWWLRTDDWAGYATALWRAGNALTLTLALRWELEQTPPPAALVANPDLPLAGRLPGFGGEWGPRAGFAWIPAGGRGPILRAGYGMYFGRTPNATLETALSQTGSPKGDLKFFMRPTDNLNTGGAPPFPYVLAGEPVTLVKPSAVEFAPGFRNAQVHQAVASVEQTLPGRVLVEVAAAVSLARRLPLVLDANIDPALNPGTITYAVVDGNGTGPLNSAQITVPFYASWPTPTGSGGRINSNYQQIDELYSRANSTYEAATLRLARSGRGGLSFHARYAYAHAMDWNPDDSVTIAAPSVLDPADLDEEYGTSDLDVRHSATAAVVWQPRWQLSGFRGRLASGWRLSSVGSFRSGLPYSMRTSGSLAREFTYSGAAIVGLSTGMSGYGGANRVYGVGRNTFRYPRTWKADLRFARRFQLGEMRELELLAQSFNLFNHQNVTELETVGYSIESGTVSGGLPSLHYLTGLKTGQTEFGQPLNVNATDSYRPRQIEFGMRLRF